MKKLLNVLRYLFFLGVGGLLLWLSFRNQSFSLVWDKIRHADPFWIAISVCLGFIALLIRAIRWKQLIEPLGYNSRLKSTYHAVMIGYLANMAIPRLGEITRCGALNRSEKIPFDKLLGTVIVERIADVLFLLISILSVAFIESDTLTNFLLAKIIEPFNKFLSNNPLVLVILLLVAAGGIFILYRIFRMTNPPAFINKLKSLIKGITAGLQSIRKLKNKPLFFFYSCAIWVIYLFMTYVCFFAMPATSHLSLGAGLVVTVLGGIGMTAPVQGGIGVYHLLVSQGLILYGLSDSDGIAFAMLVHTTQTLMLIILGFISLIALFFFTKPKPASNNGSL